jgi:hypothetical protein
MYIIKLNFNLCRYRYLIVMLDTVILVNYLGTSPAGAGAGGAVEAPEDNIQRGNGCQLS